MKPFNRFVACVLVLPILWLFLPTAALCAGKQAPAKAAKENITRHEPKVLASPQKQMTPGQAAKAKAGKKKPNWLWIGLGAAAVTVLAIAIAGAGGGDNNGKSDKPEGEGDVVVEW